jgi:aminopeptidase N
MYWLLIFCTQSILFAQNISPHRGELTKEKKAIDVLKYSLEFDFDLDNKSIAGINTITFKVNSEIEFFPLDLHYYISLDSIKQGNEKIDFVRDLSFIQVKKHFESNVEHNITVYFSGSPVRSKAPPWDAGIVWSKDSFNRHFVGIACEGYGASIWWPCKDHLSDEPNEVDIKLKIDSNYTAIGNGRLIKQEQQGNKKIFYWRVVNPINLYCITFNIGKYKLLKDYYYTQSGKKLNLDYYVLDYNKQKAERHFVQVPNMLRIFEKLFDEYPFIEDGYKLVESPYWGMEHQSSIAYGNNYLNNKFDFDFIIVHESAHEYWGNSISVNDRADLYVHEAFATYTESLFLEMLKDKATMNQYLQLQKEKIENKQAIVGKRDVAYDEWNDADMYYKGTWILHTMRQLCESDSIWHQKIKMLYQHFKYQNIDGEDLINYFDNNIISNSKKAWDHYLNELSYPTLEYKILRGDEDYFLVAKWTNVNKKFEMPIRIFYKDGSSKLISLDAKNYKKVYLSADKEVDIEYMKQNYLINFSENRKIKFAKLKSGRIIF